MPAPLVEVCVENADGLVAACAAGADRVELCAALREGGLTPSIGMVREALRAATVPCFVMVRPRGGDFLYSEIEHAAMLADLAALREMGAPGVVVGCLRPDGTVDEERTRALVAAARPMEVTFHRAFDRARDPLEALEALVRCGVDRVLTSGGQPTALEGIETLARTVRAAKGRIRVIGCGALDAVNVAEVLARTRVDELHFAPLRKQPSGMSYRNPALDLARTRVEREYDRTVTDTVRMRATLAAARAAAGEEEGR